MSKLSVFALGGLLVAILIPSAAAGVLDVPGQYPTIQLALDAAAPGDTIRVHPGFHGPITITKPVRIVGDPGVTLYNDSASEFGVQKNNITLAGPGSGTVELVSLTLSGVTNGQLFYYQGSRIKGSGFTELHIQDCQVEAPTWGGLSGTGIGASGINVDIDHVMVSHSSVGGGMQGNDGSAILPSGGYPAIGNVNGTVTVLDSTITGGPGVGGTFPTGTFPPGPCPCPYDSPFGGPFLGTGGTGIVAAQIFTSGSTVKGGSGASIYESPPLTYKGKQPEGAAYSTSSLVTLPHTLTDSGIPKLGANWSLTWTSSYPLVVLLIAGVPAKPFNYASLGWFFSDLSEVHVAEYVSAGATPTVKLLTVPNNPLIVGVEFVAQIWDPLTGMSRPVIRAIMP